jgi:sterol desaturase/sphingolipid hydroxylase (fatty acid hydroxylase superfamily)
MIICMSITSYAFSIGVPVIGFNIAYVFLIVSCIVLERVMPHDREWVKPDGQNIASILHTLSSKGTVQIMFVFSGTIGMADWMDASLERGYGIWPHDWPLAVQIIIAMIAAEFGLYWVHRLGHEVPLFWRFHSVHHSVKKLWFLNTGRFHFVDSLLSVVAAMVILLALGAPMEMLKWVSAITAFIGLLTHCNIEMRFHGWVSWIFNTPELHRWHHSKLLREGNRNYCENIMIWDHVFGSWINPRRTPPTNIGIGDYMPDKFWQQLLWPLLSVKYKQRIIPGYEFKPFVQEKKRSFGVLDRFRSPQKKGL